MSNNYTNLEVFKQVKRYFNTLHQSDQKGGVYEFFPQNMYGKIYRKSVGGSINVISEILMKYNNSVFTTLNSYYKRDIEENKSIRNSENLWGLDCIMIDIDGPSELCGKEKELYDALSWFWKEKGLLPKPNLYSFTGGGGIHLYYTFERLPKTMEKSVNNLKRLLISKIQEIEEGYEIFPYLYDDNGETITYHVDTKVVDSQRCDRVPGSINPKTGNRCVCFSTNTKRYTIQELYTYVENEVKIKNSNKKIKFHFENKTIPLVRVFSKRVKGLFELQKNGKTFYGCREQAVYIMAVSLRQLGISAEEVRKVLRSFNNGFYKPLRSCEIEGNLRSNKEYKFTNEYIKNCLQLTSEEEKIMFSAKRPGNRKERTFKNKVNIAKLVVKNKTISEIAKILNLSQSCVKHMRVAIKKEGGFKFWACGCNKKLFKKQICRTVITIKKSISDGLFRAAPKGFIFDTFIGSFCNVLNTLYKCMGTINKAKTKVEELKEHNISNNILKEINNQSANIYGQLCGLNNYSGLCLGLNA